MNELYRYRSYSENTIRELIESELWHSHVRLLNDPFEHPFEFDWNEFKIEKLPEINEHLKLLSHNQLMSLYIQQEENRVLDSYKKFIKTQLEDLGKNATGTFICCFSGACDEPLMWSHYANGMTGLCFIYDKAELSNHEKISLNQIDYNKRVKKITYRDLNASVTERAKQFSFTKGKMMNQVFAKTELFNFNFTYQKHIRWNYEAEIRSVLFAESDEENAKSGVVETVSDKALIGVIIGSRMDKTNRKVIATLCKERGIPIHVAAPNKKDYSVNIYRDVDDPVNFEES
ncbi:DUF2971 domain-containing protein [Agarivorans litoreus]|uniref:DUF2971 domain-containing protein n=1 Tax=Agarivorans litoreus TaxID=1510455 RepID=UPI001C7D1806|nr:DUF2971 domain-containing protein [Agarivorans litoreus]